MQYLVLFLLVGLGLASAYSSDFDSRLSSDRFENVEEASIQVARRGIIGDRLRQAFENLVNKMKKSAESGSGISEDVMKRAEDMYEKMINLNVEISEKTRTIFEDLRSKFGRKSGMQRSLEGDRLKKDFEDLVNAMKLVVDVGKGLPDSLVKEAEDMYEKLKSLQVEISDDVKSAFEEVRAWMGRHSARRGIIGDRLRQAFENLVNKMKKSAESGSGINEDVMKRAEDMYEKMINLNIEISEKTKTIFEDLRSKFGRKSGMQRSSEGDRLKKDFEDLVNAMKLVVDVGKGLPDSLVKEAEDMYEELKSLQVEISDDVKSAFEEVRAWMGRHSVQRGPVADRLKEAFENILNRMKEEFESGKGVSRELMKKAEDMFEKMKSMKITACYRNLRLFEDLRNKMGLNGPASQDADISNIFDVFKRLKQVIKEKVNLELLKEKVEELFGKQSGLSKQIVEMLKTQGEKAKQKILDWVDRILPDKEERSISEVYDKLREFFKELQLDLKERFSKFGEWVKEQYEKRLEKGKTKAENIKRIAIEFIEDTRVIGKDMAEEALGFFREYKHDLGKHYENVVEKIGKILKS